MTSTATDKSIIVLALAKDREDGGKTENYRVYAGGGTVQMKNRRGEVVSKNAILGGNGTIYIANELAGEAKEFVLLPKAMYDKLAGAQASIKQKGKKT